MTEKKNAQTTPKKRLSLADLHEVVAGDNTPTTMTGLAAGPQKPGSCGAVTGTVCR